MLFRHIKGRFKSSFKKTSLLMSSINYLYRNKMQEPYQDCNETITNSKESAPSSESSQAFFSPFTANTLKIHSSFGFLYGCAYYSQKHNMIIACPSDNTVQFYDATTLLPLKERENLKLDGSVKEISFQPENDVFLLRCLSGSIYSYNVSLHAREKILKDNDIFALAVEFVDSKSFAVSAYSSSELQIGSLDDENLLRFDSRDSDPFYLHCLLKSRLLLTSLEGGSVLVYRTDKLPHLPVIGQLQAENSSGESVALTQSFMMSGKEYVMTTAQDSAIKIWHKGKGKMRLVKVIRKDSIIRSWVYLENYKMIAVVYQFGKMEFFRLASGKSERTLKLKISDVRSMFLMKDKNMIGVTSSNQSLIEFVPLHPF